MEDIIVNKDYKFEEAFGNLAALSEKRIHSSNLLVAEPNVP